MAILDSYAGEMFGDYLQPNEVVAAAEHVFRDGGREEGVDCACDPVCLPISVVIPVTDMQSPLAATRSILSFVNNCNLCCTARNLLMMVLVLPVSGMAETWKAAVVIPCASLRKSGGVPDAKCDSLEYSGGGSWLVDGSWYIFN